MTAKYVIGTPEFIANLDGWLFKNDQRHADYLRRVRSKVPPMFTKYDGFLYRGMTVDASVLESGVITIDRYSSWAKSEKAARRFAEDKKYSLSNGLVPGVKVLLKKRVPSSKVVLDVHGFVLFMGGTQLEMLGMDPSSVDSAVNEEEVLCDRGVSVHATEIVRLDKI